MQSNEQKQMAARAAHNERRGIIKRTCALVAAFLVVVYGALIYRLYNLQLQDSTYRADAAEQQLSDEIIPAARGSIYDSTGKLLAKSTVVWNVTADPSKCNPKYAREAAKQIAGLIGDNAQEEDIYEKLTAEGSQYKVLAKKLDMLTADKILEYATDLNTKVGATVLRLAREQASTRDYPYGAFLSSVLGFCNNDGDGFYGLEKSYEETLGGTPGRVISSQNAQGYELANDSADSHEAIDGNNLNLSIDVNIQGIVERYLEKAVDDYNVQNRASAIVMNVNTGEILAMASVQQYDPNTPYVIYDKTLSDILENRTLDATGVATLQCRLGKKAVADIIADGTIDDDEYTNLQGMMREAQWKNKNVTELYYPGSVFKLITTAAALDSGVMNENQNYYCSGAYSVATGTNWEQVYHCAAANNNETTIHGMQDMRTALNNSCNIYYIQVGQALGSTRFYNYFNAFGFTGTTGVDLPNETRWMQYYDADELGESELASSAFGQAQKITPLQMATAVAAVVNGGYLVTPRVVNSITDSSGNTVETFDTTVRRQVISEEVSETIRGMMEYVVGGGDKTVSHGGANAYVAGYRIGGKSGTSEQLDVDLRGDGDYRKVSSFTAVLPIDDPEIEVFVMLDDPRWTYDYASRIVAPVVGNIISEVAPYLGLERDAAYSPDSSVQIPNCIGNTWTDAQVKLNVQGLSHKIIGSSDGDVLYQYPFGGTSIGEGSTIYLYTESTTDSMAIVPDVTGKSADFAKQMLSAAGLNASVDGDSTARVIGQSIEAESSVPMGTVVTITAG